ncbi:hypothetical protein MBLNU230_g1653t1 [Neophaeotheca triangularis]
MQPPPGLMASQAPIGATRPPASPEFLLAFLALTARFHPVLVEQHSPPTATRASNPLIAAEYYAVAAHEHVASAWTGNDSGLHIEKIQAALMLGLHEWGMCRGAKAWLIVGGAIRSAQAMGLQYDQDLDDEPMSRSLALEGELEKLGLPTGQSGKSSAMGQGDEEWAFINQEVRRRTFWSCFIMDRYLSSGKYRPQMLHARELRIQLPASERSFTFAEKVRTLMLGEEERDVASRDQVQNNRQESVRHGTGEEPGFARNHSINGVLAHDNDEGLLEIGDDEGLVSRYIKILEIYGKVIRWSCAGGRRVEQYPPWDSRCEWFKLRRLCTEFKASLPRQHVLTARNTQAHIDQKTSPPYTLVHTLLALCLIMLHREYVPFIPIRCPKPQGPLDPPLFPKDRFDVPEGFWEESARECFKAAREMMDLVQTCQQWNALVETPIVGFAIYTVAFVGVYCINFPNMDPDGFMCTQPSSKPSGPSAGESEGFKAARKALETVGQMRPRLYMADGWFKTINRMHKYFRRMKSDYKKNVNSNASGSDDSPIAGSHTSVREGGIGGGLDEYTRLERVLKDFGNLEDEEVEIKDISERHSSRPLDAVYDDSPDNTTVKSEEADNRHASSETSRQQQDGPWKAVNTIPGADVSRQPSMSAPANGPFRSYDSYHPQPTQSQPPQQTQQQAQSAYTPLHLNNFRPAYSSETPVPPGGAPPSLTSPASHSATTASQPSPPFDRGNPMYAGWTPHNAAYTPKTPQHHSQQQQPYSNAPTHQQQFQQQQQQQQHHHLQQSPTHQMHHQPYATYPAYPSPSQQPTQQQQQQAQHIPSHLPPQPQMSDPVPPPRPAPVWDPMVEEAWFKSLDTRFGGDDIACFVDGGEVSEWAGKSLSRQYGGEWLGNVWANGGGGGFSGDRGGGAV